MDIIKKTIEISILKCPKCGHEWTPKHLSVLPKVCPRCKFYLDKANKTNNNSS